MTANSPEIVGLLPLLHDVDVQRIEDGLLMAAFNPANLSEAQAAALIRVVYGIGVEVHMPDGRVLTCPAGLAEFVDEAWTAAR